MPILILFVLLFFVITWRIASGFGNAVGGIVQESTDTIQASKAAINARNDFDTTLKQLESNRDQLKEQIASLEKELNGLKSRLSMATEKALPAGTEEATPEQFCGECGAELTGAGRFCPECGLKVPEDEPIAECA